MSEAMPQQRVNASKYSLGLSVSGTLERHKYTTIATYFANTTKQTKACHLGDELFVGDFQSDRCVRVAQ